MLNNLLVRWTDWVIRHALLVMILTGMVTVFAGWYAVTAFSMNSDTGRLIRQDTDWRVIHDEFTSTFPQYDQNTFVVVSGTAPWVTADVTRALGNEIRAADDLFSTVYAPATNDFLDEHALLFLETDTLNDTISRLAEAQPFLTAVAEHDSMKGVLDLLIDALTRDEELPTGFTRIVDAFAIAGERAATSAPKPINWRDELFQDDEDRYYQVIFVKGRQDFGRDLPNSLIINRLGDLIEDFSHPAKDDVQIRLSGQVPLEHGEIVSAMDSARLAGTLALLILVGVLIWGVRSVRIIGATYLSMIVGLIWTGAFAMVAVGQFNTISIIFLVMFIGLGVDFAIHLCLKYQESLAGADRDAALIEMNADLGPAIMLCGVTSALGFVSFVPTNYVGLAEMGIISGGGMIIAVIISLTVIPAFFALVKTPVPAAPQPFIDLMTRDVASHSRKVSTVTILIAVVLALISTQADFDYSTLSLKDPDSEAMTTLRELHEEDIITDYALTWVAPDVESAESVRHEIEALAEVSEVLTPLDYLPGEQDEKLFMLEDAVFLLGPLFYPAVSDETYTDQDFVDALSDLDAALEAQLERNDLEPGLAGSFRELRTIVNSLASAPGEQRARFTSLIIPPLKEEITWLARALNAGEVTLANLPGELQERLIAGDGRVVVTITPAEDVVPVDAMRQYTQAVKSIVPEVTGRPVLDLGIGDIVIEAFALALFIAITTIFIILMITLRSVVDSILVFIPLVMTALATLTVSVLIDLPLNMANVVVIPLIFGLGVDNGVHIVKRFHQSRNVSELINSSTPRAVFLSNLTTLGTFCALSFSTHQGIYSIGVLLTVALSCLMLLTLVSLPALLETFSRARAIEQAG